MFSGVLSEGSLPGRFLFVADAVSLKFLTHNSTVWRLGTFVPMNIEVPTKYPLSHNDRIIVLEIPLHSESPMLYRPALHGNLNALSLTRRVLKDKFPTQTIPLTAVLPNHQVFLPDPLQLTFGELHVDCLCLNAVILYTLFNKNQAA